MTNEWPYGVGVPRDLTYQPKENPMTNPDARAPEGGPLWSEQELLAHTDVLEACITERTGVGCEAARRAAREFMDYLWQTMLLRRRARPPAQPAEGREHNWWCRTLSAAHPGPCTCFVGASDADLAEAIRNRYTEPVELADEIAYRLALATPPAASAVTQGERPDCQHCGRSDMVTTMDTARGWHCTRCFGPAQPTPEEGGAE
jgi:hypothetical protein